MRANWKRGLGLVGIAAVLAGVWPLYERFFGRDRLRFPYLGHPIPDAAYNALAAKPGWARARLEVAPGIALNGLIRKPRKADAPWILYYPGNDPSQLDRGQGFLIRLGNDEAWGLAVFADRGYDSSDGTSSLESISGDAPRILSQLCATEHVPPARVHLVGFSIGGHFAVHAARGAALAGQRAASLTLLASVDDIVMFHRSAWEQFSPGDDYQTRPLLGEVPAPVLVIQGDKDSALRGPQQGRDIAATLGARAHYEELAGVDHVPLLENARALELVRDFVRAHAQ